MKQEKLEQKVRELFERQGFQTQNQDKNLVKAVKDENQLRLRICSSQKYTPDQAKKQVKKDEKVFVDEKLADIENKIENQVSTIKEEEDEEEYNLPSYELIGEIAVINELTVDKKEAINGILNHHPSVKTILLKKEGGLKGEYRIGDYEKLYGSETETIHKEHGCKFKADPTKAFFSEREGTERKRILDSVQDGERILVMFCGIGPYPVILGKKRDVEVVGVEKNPEAVKYAEENLVLNDIEGSADIIRGDVGEIVPTLDSFDVILMPSPTNAEEYFEEALTASSPGTKIIIYSIADREDLFTKTVELIREKADEVGFEIRILDKRIVSDYSPQKKKIAVELQVI